MEFSNFEIITKSIILSFLFRSGFCSFIDGRFDPKEFSEMGEVDFVIGNEDEIKSLFETDDLEVGLAKTSAICPLVVCTRSGDGVTVIGDGTRIDVPVTKVVPVDATGAGDQFAAGFLFGLATGRDLETCAKIGNICAAEVISHIGPRPETNMQDLLREAGLL